MIKPSPTHNEPDGPARPSELHRQDRPLSVVAGTPKGFRRIDGLQWLLDHKSISPQQFDAGRRLQADWQSSKIERSPRMMFSPGGGGSSDLPDAVLDAGTRFKDAMAVLPTELVGLTTLFLLPEDHPFSLERCAAIVREDRKAASFGIRISLSLLARHYGT